MFPSPWPVLSQQVKQGKPHGNVGAMAVKRFNKEKIRISPKQFENEVHNLSRIEHKNIVRLMGYCDEIREVLSYRKNKKNDDQPVREYIQERLLCYEYMPNGSLEKIIYGMYISSISFTVLFI